MSRKAARRSKAIPGSSRLGVWARTASLTTVRRRRRGLVSPNLVPADSRGVSRDPGIRHRCVKPSRHPIRDRSPTRDLPPCSKEPAMRRTFLALS
ncbi:MAG: hypothetical protein ACK55I_05335, partial [bacterium]